MEELVLDNPVVIAPVSTTKYRVIKLIMETEPSASPPPPGEPGLVMVILKDNNHVFTTCSYMGSEAITLIKTINTANCSVKSMNKRMLEKLNADGKIPGGAGTVSGTPDPL